MHSWSVHPFTFTSRRWWDVFVSPQVGYSLGRFYATPVASEILSGYYGDTKRNANGFIIGAELCFTAYFTGGFYISAGFEWSMILFNLDDSLSLTNTQTSATYGSGKSFNIHSYSFILSIGYAFSN